MWLVVDVDSAFDDTWSEKTISLTGADRALLAQLLNALYEKRPFVDSSGRMTPLTDRQLGCLDALISKVVR